MKKWTWLISLFGLVISQYTYAQNLPLGSWRTHFSYNSITNLTQGNGKIFAATKNGLFYLETSSMELETLSKTDGLSDAGISALIYDELTKTLVIGYESGLIDLHSGGKVRTIRDLKTSSLVGEKKVFDIASDGNNAYLGTSFGVIVVSLAQKEITDNYRSIGSGGEDLTVYELEIVDDKLFILSDNVIQNGLLSDNLLDFNNWNSQSITPNSIRTLTSGNELYAVSNDTSIVSIKENSIDTLDFANDNPITDLTYSESLTALIDNSLININDGSITTIGIDEEKLKPTTIISSNGIWIGTEESGLISPSQAIILPNGPLSDNITNLSFTNNMLFTFYGMDPELYSGQIDSLGYSQFDNNEWNTIMLSDFYNISDGVYFNNRMVFSSIGFGLYDQSINSTVTSFSNDSDFVIPRMSLSDGTLYLPSFDADTPLYSWDREEVVTAYSESQVGTRFPIDLAISDFGSIWVSRATFNGGGFMVTNFDSQESRVITGADGLPSSSINGLSIDLGDEAWVATNNGLAIFPDASFIFNTSDAIQPIFENSELFEDEEVFAVAVDGGNRIWMSTRDGLYIFNNTLSVLEEFFDENNSPLPSNMVTDFAYNGATGEMYMTTNKGLVSYRSSSSMSRTTSTNAQIYPNPVRPGYDGLIGITNLGRDVSVKITDTNGKLIRSINANGGTASWNLLDYNSRKIKSGVYIIMTSSADGIDTYLGKIAILD